MATAWQHLASSHMTLREATIMLGFIRPNTVRENYLGDTDGRKRFGVIYYAGFLLLNRSVVEEEARVLEEKRREGGNFRLKNLGRFGKKPGTSQKTTTKRTKKKRADGAGSVPPPSNGEEEH